MVCDCYRVVEDELDRLVRPPWKIRMDPGPPGQGKVYQAGLLGSAAEVTDGRRIRQGPTSKIHLPTRSMLDLQIKCLHPITGRVH
jgi:hypothetical protein